MQKNSDSVIIKSTKNVCLDTLETIGVTKFKKILFWLDFTHFFKFILFLFISKLLCSATFS